MSGRGKGKLQLTPEQCAEFRRDPTRNPATGAKIQVGKGTYNELVKICGQPTGQLGSPQQNVFQIPSNIPLVPIQLPLPGQGPVPITLPLPGQVGQAPTVISLPVALPNALNTTTITLPQITSRSPPASRSPPTTTTVTYTGPHVLVVMDKGDTTYLHMIPRNAETADLIDDLLVIDRTNARSDLTVEQQDIYMNIEGDLSPYQANTFIRNANVDTVIQIGIPEDDLGSDLDVGSITMGNESEEEYNSDDY